MANLNQKVDRFLKTAEALGPTGSGLLSNYALNYIYRQVGHRMTQRDAEKSRKAVDKRRKRR